jgi:alpha-L-rhamnosidase
MNSFNHYAFGSVMAWVYRSVAGIDTDVDGAGFQHIVVRPQVAPLMHHAHGEYASAYGKVVTDWTMDAGVFRLKVQIPPNARASVFLPNHKIMEIGSGTYQF